MSEHQENEPAPNVIATPDQMGGVWSNWARVSHSPYEFTLDFVRLDFTMNPPQGVLVARVNLSPLMITQLMEALQMNWDGYAEKSMPKEVDGHDD